MVHICFVVLYLRYESFNIVVPFSSEFFAMSRSVREFICICMFSVAGFRFGMLL